MKKIFLVLFTFLITNISFLQAQKTEYHNFKVFDIYGEQHLLQDYLDDGKYVFINFFGVACGSCQLEAYRLDVVYRELGCNCNDIVFLGIEISSWTTNEDVYEFCQSYSMTFDVASGLEGGGHGVAYLLGIYSTPYALLISPDQEILIDGNLYLDIQGIRDTLAYYDLYQPYTCEGTDILDYRLCTDTDTIIGVVDNENFEVNIQVPIGTDLSSCNSIFVISTNSTGSVDGIKQISGETLNNFYEDIIFNVEAANTVLNTDWTIITEEVASVNENINTFKIYPNPATDFLNIELPTNNEFETFSIFDIIGNEIFSGTINNNENLKINIQNYNSGIYFIKFQSDNTIIKKFIK